MELRLSRVSPTLGCQTLSWSHDAALAIGTNNGVVIYELDGIGLVSKSKSNESLWRRHDISLCGTANSGIKCAVTEMSWSKSMKGSGCILAVLSEDSTVSIIKSEGYGRWQVVLEVDTQGRSIHCLGWCNDKLYLGSKDNLVLEYSFNSEFNLDSLNHTHRLPGAILHMSCTNEGSICVGLHDNSVHLLGHGEVLPESKQLLFDIVPTSSGGFLVAQTRRLTGLSSKGAINSSLDVATSDFLYPVPLSDEISAISFNGKCINSGAVQAVLPKSQSIQFHGIAVHPSQTIMAVMYCDTNPRGWSAPILSTQSVSVNVIYMGSEPPTVQNLNDGDGKSLWLASRLSELPPVAPKLLQNESKRAEDLTSRLSDLFCSNEFCRIRGQWLAQEGLPGLIKTARCLIFSLIDNFTPQNTIDKAILQSYGALCGRGVALEEVTEVSGGFFEQKFDFNQASDDLMSLDGIKWRRCAITLLPILTIDALESSDGAYARLPKTSTTLAGSKLAVALIEASEDFCIFNGARWHRRAV